MDLEILIMLCKNKGIKNYRHLNKKSVIMILNNLKHIDKSNMNAEILLSKIQKNEIK